MRIEVGVLGATGVVGQQLVAMLDGHPWFDLVWVAASERSAGRAYGDLPWRLPRPIPSRAAGLVVSRPDPERAPRLVFSALDAAAAGSAEPAFAAHGCVVVSNARNYRLDPLVPLVIPEVNPGHLALLGEQRAARGWTGALVTNPNCSTVFVAMVLAALRPFHPSRVARHDAPGGIRRRPSRRVGSRCTRERHPVHRWRRGKDRTGNAPSPRYL
jgi:aspartate-semialdehyde dehydrogenase